MALSFPEEVQIRHEKKFPARVVRHRNNLLKDELEASLEVPEVFGCGT